MTGDGTNGTISRHEQHTRTRGTSVDNVSAPAHVDSVTEY